MFTKKKKFNIEKLAQSIAQYQRQGYSLSQIKKTAYKQGVSAGQFRKAARFYKPSRIWPMLVFVFWTGVVSLTTLVSLYFGAKFLFERNTLSLSYNSFDEFLTETGYRPDDVFIRLNAEGATLYSHNPNLPELFDNTEDMFVYISQEMGKNLEWHKAHILFDRKNNPIKNEAWFKIKDTNDYFSFEFYSQEDEFTSALVREGKPGAYILQDRSRGFYSSMNLGTTLDESKWDGFRKILAGKLITYEALADGFLFSFERELEYLNLPETASSVNKIKITGSSDPEVIQADERVFQKVFVSSKEPEEEPERKILAPRG